MVGNPQPGPRGVGSNSIPIPNYGWTINPRKRKMSNEDLTKMIPSKTPESAAMLASVKRAMAITPTLNRLTFVDADKIRAVFSDLIGHKVDESFSLIPPFYTTGGENIRVGRNVFINQNCTMYDLGGIDIADDVMIGPNVSIITSGHPIEPSQRRAFVIAKPIVIERSVWIAAGATIIGGVTVGENSVVAAGSVVTRDVPPGTVVGGNPARVIRSIGG
jgi:acetyltransferase-like isoleucine patch superfamily enzyme